MKYNPADIRRWPRKRAETYMPFRYREPVKQEPILYGLLSLEDTVELARRLNKLKEAS